MKVPRLTINYANREMAISRYWNSVTKIFQIGTRAVDRQSEIGTAGAMHRQFCSNKTSSEFRVISIRKGDEEYTFRRYMVMPER